MIFELHYTGSTTTKGEPLWRVEPSVHNVDSLPASNALDWLWQKLSVFKVEFMVAVNRNMLYVTDNRLQIPNDDIPILFTGTARDIVMQLRPYMRMMEGQ